jgi:hypothetical protein
MPPLPSAIQCRKSGKTTLTKPERENGHPAVRDPQQSLMHTNPNHSSEALRRETASLLELARKILTSLDALEFPPSRPVELALELRERLRRREQEILTDQLVELSRSDQLLAGTWSHPLASPGRRT